MRYIKTSISLLIGLIGLVIYFVTIPTINQENIVDLKVQAGEESLLDNLYLNGYLYPEGDFIATNQETTLLSQLPYLQKIDSSGSPQLYMLQENYPDFINNLIHNMSIYSFGVTVSENSLIAGSFGMENASYYYPNFNELHVHVLDRSTGEVTVETVTRSNAKIGDNIDFIAIYQDYPRVKFLVNTGEWNQSGYDEKSELSIIEYNLETKDYSEKPVLKDDGYVYGYTFSSVSTNEALSVLTLSSNMGGTTFYAFDFEGDTIHEIGNEMDQFTVSEESNLYSITEEEGQFYLNAFDKQFDVSDTVALQLEAEQELSGDMPMISMRVYNERLYVTMSRHLIYTEESQVISPSLLYVFDINTGEQLLEGEINYDPDKQIEASEGIINEIGILDYFQ